MQEPHLPSVAAPRPSPLATPKIPARAVDPTLTILQALDDRLARMERQMNQMSQLAEQVPGLAEMGLDTLDEVAVTHRLHERSEAAVALLERVSRPQTLDKLTQLVEVLDMVPGQIQMAIDMMDEVGAEAERRGVDLSRLVPQGADLLTHWTIAHQQALDAPESEIGILGLLCAAREPEMRRAMAFLVELGRGLGRQMSNDDSSPRGALPAAK